MLAELQADNPDGKLFVNAYCRVAFEIPADQNAVHDAGSDNRQSA